MTVLRPLIAVALPLLLACGGAPGPPPVSARVPPVGDDYLRSVAVRDGYNDTYLLHWSVRQMPLEVFLPRPPADLFEDLDAVQAEVRRAVLDWTDVAAPGVPSFVFVDSHGDADIPIVWAREPDGDWYIAFCSYNLNLRQQRFGVEQILVTGRYAGGQVANLDDIHETVLHEMGHALGLMGHSDDPNDIMFPNVTGRPEKGLSDRDRRTLAALYEHGSRQIRGRRGRRY